MNAMTTIVTYVLTSLVAGLLGGAAMELTMWLISRGGWAKGDMIVALGSLVTKSRENAYRVGAILHAISAVGFAAVYVMLMIALGFTHLPHSLALGVGVGVLHGMIVSLMLVWVISEQHPLQEFNEAGFAVGLTHFVAHVAFGAVVGLVVGISPL
ncbi:MAG: hypothetical protein JWM88_1310 [Verrucomicrobia bacterium]|nr:hypothetical protein [Verrucomicrobiota bacterium]